MADNDHITARPRRKPPAVDAIASAPPPVSGPNGRRTPPSAERIAASPPPQSRVVADLSAVLASMDSLRNAPAAPKSAHQTESTLHQSGSERHLPPASALRGHVQAAPETAPSHAKDRRFTSFTRALARRSLELKRRLRASGARAEVQRIALEQSKADLAAAVERALQSGDRAAEAEKRLADIKVQLGNEVESVRQEGERQLGVLRGEQAIQIEDLTRQVTGARDALSRVEKERGAVFAQLKERERELEEHRRSLLDSERKSQDKHTMLAEAEATLERTRKQRDEAKRQLEDLSTLYGTASTHLTDIQVRLAEATSRIGDFERLAKTSAEAAEKEIGLQDAIRKAESAAASSASELDIARKQDEKHRTYIRELEQKNTLAAKAVSDITILLLTAAKLSDRALENARKALSRNETAGFTDVTVDLGVSKELLDLIREGLLGETPSLKKAQAYVDKLYGIGSQEQAAAEADDSTPTPTQESEEPASAPAPADTPLDVTPAEGTETPAPTEPPAAEEGSTAKPGWLARILRDPRKEKEGEQEKSD